MKSKIEAATVAFGSFLTALVMIAMAIVADKPDAPAKEEEEEEPKETAAAKKKRLAAEAAAKEEADDADLLGGEEEEQEEKVTIADLKAAGQVLIKAGKADKFKALLKKHSAENLGGLEEDVYPEFLAALKKLAK